jgi:pyridoxamine 5'-phosphate oxidase
MSRVSGEALRTLTDWLPPNDEPERPQIQLATVDADGRPDVRTVLLSEWDADGFVFSTDADSRKTQQLESNPAVAILVLWPAFTRQLVIRGAAEPADAACLARTFERRSPYLKQLAWQNSAALAEADRAERTAEWARFRAEHDVEHIDAPPTWAGYLVRPDRLTFWRSDPDGPSHRVEYRLQADGAWSEHHLAG